MIRVLVVLAIAVAGLLSLWLEGYAARIDGAFALYAVVMCLLAAWVAASAISTRRLFRLVAIAGAGSYATQYVGATLGQIWSYPAPDRTYYFAPAAFMIASLVTYGLAAELLAPFWRRRLSGLPRWVNPAVVVVIIGVVVLTSSPYRDGQGAIFWIYYGAMFVAALSYAVFMDTATLLALVVSSIVVGFCSESLGARSTLWTFDNDPGSLPPVWLILGSWPLEIMMPFCFSAARSGSVEPARSDLAVTGATA